MREAHAGGPGTTTAQLLKVPVGSRAIGMGESFSAVADDSSALWWNPAGLARLEQREANFMHSSLIESIKFNHLALALPGESYSVATSLSLLSYGDIAGYDDTGSSIGNQDASSLVAALGGATTLKERLSLGLSGKFIREKLADVSATGIGVDVGGLYELPWRPFDGTYSAALVLQNLGQGLQFDTERGPLPRKVKFGLGGMGLLKKSLNLSLDITDPNDNKMYPSFGAEYWIKQMFAIRAGYMGLDSEGKGMRVGFGVKLAGIHVDYAYASFGDLGATHRVGFTYRWGNRMRQMNSHERSLLKEAKADMEKKRYTSAILKLNRLLEEDPSDTRILHMLVQAHEAMIRTEIGEAMEQAASELAPEEGRRRARAAEGEPRHGRAAEGEPRHGRGAGDEAFDPTGLDDLPGILGRDIPNAPEVPVPEALGPQAPPKAAIPAKDPLLESRSLNPTPDLQSGAWAKANPKAPVVAAPAPAPNTDPLLNLLDIYGQ